MHQKEKDRRKNRLCKRALKMFEFVSLDLITFRSKTIKVTAACGLDGTCYNKGYLGTEERHGIQ